MFISLFPCYPRQVAQSTASFPLLDMLLLTFFFNSVNLILLLLVLLVKLLKMFEIQANVGELARLLRYFRFSHQCSWTFESSGMWCRVDGRMVHGVSTDRKAFIFRVKNSFLTACAEDEGHTMLGNVGHYSSSDTALRPRKSESSRTFVLSLHTETW